MRSLRHITISLLRRRMLLAVGLALLLVVLFLWPQAARAENDCDSSWPSTNLACQADVVRYEAQRWWAAQIWGVDRGILQGSYWAQRIRWWIVEVAFTSAFDAMTEAVGPLLEPFGVLAIILVGLGLMAMPITGSKGPINLRVVLTWLLIGPLAFTLMGPYLVELERFRSDMGVLLFSGVTNGIIGIDTTADGGVGMADPNGYYREASSCGLDANGQPSYARPGGGDSVGLDAQVAALLWADVVDVHCPYRGGGEDPTLPRRFYASPPGFARSGGIRNLGAVDRAVAIEQIGQAADRLKLAILPACLAWLKDVIDLVFSLCMIMLVLSFPLGVLFGLFRANNGWFVDLLKRGGQIIMTSWLISLVLGLITALLNATAQAGNVGGYAGIVFVLLLLIAKFGMMSLGLINESLGTMTAVMGMGGGPSLGQLAGGAAGLALGAVTGGAGLALTAGAALKQTGSARYAAGAVAGRFKPLMELGSVASSMGLLDGEVSAGLYAGYRTRKSPQGYATMAADRTRKIKGRDGTERTIEQRVADRRLESQIDRVEHGNLAQRTMTEVGRAAIAAADLPQHIGTRAQTLASGVRVVRSGVQAARRLTPRQMVQGAQNVARNVLHSANDAARDALGAVAVRAVDAVIPPNPYDALRLDQGKPVFSPRVPTAQLPAGAQQHQQLTARQRADLLRQGATVQRNPDGSFSWWGVPQSAPAAAPPPPAQAHPAPQPRPAARPAPGGGPPRGARPPGRARPPRGATPQGAAAAPTAVPQQQVPVAPAQPAQPAQPAPTAQHFPTPPAPAPAQQPRTTKRLYPASTQRPPRRARQGRKQRRRP